jgi:hypothetical protein
MHLAPKQHVSWLRPSLADPLLIRVYEEVLARRQRWQESIQRTIRTVLGLGDTDPFDPDTVLSAAEIRAQMSEHLPYEEKLSGLIVAMREE